ncbi:MAG TPA: adenylate/guanylate cyclase domain-containing protein [Chloroflexota bacterium]
MYSTPSEVPTVIPAAASTRTSRAATASAERARARPYPRFSLRLTLLLCFAVLLVLTVGSIGVVAFRNTRQSIEALAGLHYAAVSRSTAREVERLLEPAAPILENLQTQAQRGWLPLDDPDAVADYLAERLRAQRNLAWLSYSAQANGRFAGAWRCPAGTVIVNYGAPWTCDADTIILNHVSPDIDNGRPWEFLVRSDGSRTPMDREGRGTGYDPRERDWYRLAMADPGHVEWTEPYRFLAGEMGITATLAVRLPGVAEPQGAFTADFFLDDIARFLANLQIGRHGRAYVLSRRGAVVAGPPASQDDASPAVLAAVLDDVAPRLATLPTDSAETLTVEHAGLAYDVVFQAFRVPGGPEWITAVVVPVDEFLGVVYQNAAVTLLVGMGFLALAVLLGYVLAYRITHPLRAIAADLEQVGSFRLSALPAPHSFVKEIAIVSDSVERMKASLRSFGRYVPAALVEDVITSGREARLGGECRVLTIHFSDIVGFTSISEALDPTQLVEHLGEYLQAMTEIVRRHDGTIDKFMGDGILAFYNAPNAVPAHAAQACRAALAAHRCLDELRPRWQAAGKPAFRTRIGLHTGEALVGNIGTPERFAYTVIGDAVNLASRLEALNKVYATEILASQEVREAAGPGFVWRQLDRVAVVGRREGTLVNELLGKQGDVPPDVLHARDLYEAALAAYFGQRFAEAAVGFRAAAAALPTDRAAVQMAERAEVYQHFPPGESWGGLYLQAPPRPD